MEAALMDLLSLIVRSLASFLFLLVLLRLTGKRTIYQGSSFDFVLALVLGDLVDNAVFGQSPFAQFAVAAITLVGTRLAFTLHKGRAHT
jgi:uncharacterized membrane protein YcaP (DUF421 family)